jgi:hypothetical protein
LGGIPLRDVPPRSMGHLPEPAGLMQLPERLDADASRRS